MTLTLVLALMTAAAIFAVLWPLSRRPRAAAAGAGELAVYRDQLDEIARDQATGLIGTDEADAARIEVSRRLLAVADRRDAAKAEKPDKTAASAAAPAATPSATWRRRAVALVTLVATPLIAAALYLTLGSPNLPDQPLAARRVVPPNQQSIENLIAQVETHLEQNPADARGWEVVAPVYMRLGRYDDAVRARRHIIEFDGETAARLADLGEAMTAAAGGVVTAEANALLDRAVALDAKEVKARYLLGLAAEQDGRKADAATIWRGMLAEATENTPWTGMVRRALARVDPASAATTAPAANAPGPSADDVAAASQMDPAQRMAMIKGMVAGLAQKLAADGGDLDGWLRLMRSYLVLGEADKARAAAGDARRALADDPDKLNRLNDGIKALGLES